MIAYVMEALISKGRLLMKKILAGVELVAVFLLLVLSGIVFLQVILRNFFETGFVWNEEFSRFLLLSIVLIAAPVVFYRNDHVRFDMLAMRFSERFRKIQSLLSVLVVIAFYSVYIISHFLLMKNSGNVLSPSLNLPNTIFFSAGLIGAILGVGAGIARFLRILFYGGRQ
ncbi:TRAP transporter small permease subunit [Marispirochaeta sp.]|jgi:TRAP-type transport system small permease protein|uniref:TRAP transporter small permease n=1 Tax=Marispirochaeta sp. TaxID=2038653 RepID=UPI0029C947A3|nr:TRAP transporter small permease subunit [Marispirochaeta sp.]